MVVRTRRVEDRESGRGVKRAAFIHAPRDSSINRIAVVDARSSDAWVCCARGFRARPLGPPRHRSFWRQHLRNSGHWGANSHSWAANGIRNAELVTVDDKIEK